MAQIGWANHVIVGLLAVAGATLATGCNCCKPWHNGDSSELTPTSAPTTTSPNRAAAAGHDPIVQFGQTSSDGPSAGDVNIFGEMKGQQVSAVRPGGEANFQQHTYVEQGYDADVTVDPTGKWLAFASTRDSEHTSLYLQRTDGAAVIQLTSGTADDANPAFSPDGRQIAFSSTRAGNWQIFLMSVDGKSVTQVTTGPMQAAKSISRASASTTGRWHGPARSASRRCTRSGR